jgi:Flp pilus assembly protein TadG
MKTVNDRRRRGGQRGQAIVIMALAFVGILTMTSVIVDGGNAWAQQRATQNASDAAALAGATVMVQNLAGVAKTNHDVYTAIQTSLTQNVASLASADYVAWDHSVVGPVTDNANAIPPTAAGVNVHGTRNFSTYLAGIVGIHTLDTGAEATAVAGTLQGICSADSGCGVLPVTFSVNVEDCSGTGAILAHIGVEWPVVGIDTARADKGVGRYEGIYPLCKNGPGGVGWLDFGCPGNLQQQIANPCNVSFDLPTWIHTSPGNPNSVDNEMNLYDDKIVLIPLFDGTCRSVPNSGLLADCTNPGNGNNLYYHIPKFVAMLLDHAYIQGNNHPECNSAPGGPPVGGNGSNGCLKGWFIRYVTQGPVGQFDPNQDQGAALGVQLIK